MRDNADKAPAADASTPLYGATRSRVRISWSDRSKRWGEKRLFEDEDEND